MSHTDVSPKEARAQLKRLLVAREQRPQPKPGGWAVAWLLMIVVGCGVGVLVSIAILEWVKP